MIPFLHRSAVPAVASRLRGAVLLLAAALLSGAAVRQAPALAAADALLATDRMHAARAGTRSVVEALDAMFADDIAMQAPGGFVNGRDSVLATLRRNPANLAGRVRWTPIRGGISGDGTHGFTFGHMTLTRPDSAPLALKYMSYWVKRDGTWRVVAYKRGLAGAGAPDTSLRAPSLPARWGSPYPGAADAARDVASAEAAFSALAGRVGLREAFRLTGAPDAVNMGGAATASFVHGPGAISELVGQGEPPGGSALTWGADRVLAAPSGDLAISIGTIIAPARTAGGPPARIPFYTIWRRDAPGAPWRYVAE